MALAFNIPSEGNELREKVLSDLVRGYIRDMEKEVAQELRAGGQSTEYPAPAWTSLSLF